MSNPEGASDQPVPTRAGDSGSEADPDHQWPAGSPMADGAVGADEPITTAQLGEGLRGLRTIRGWSQNDVAHPLGWRTPKLSRFELGQRVPSGDDLQALLDFYRVPPTERRVWFEARDDAESTWILDQILAATDAKQLVDSVIASASFDALTQLAHQLRGLLWTHEQHIDRADIRAALQTERKQVGLRLAVIGPDTTAVPIVARSWGARARELRDSAACAAEPNPHVPRDVAEAIFEQAVAPLLTNNHTSPRQQPAATIVVGPPGSTAPAVARICDTSPGGAVALHLDELRAYHPAYPTLLTRHPGVLIDATDPTATWWLTQAIHHHLTTARRNIVINAPTGPDDLTTRARLLADAGYQVHLHILGAPTTVAALTSVESYRHQTTHAGAGHWIPAGVLHANHHATTRTLELAQHTDNLTTITVHPLHDLAQPPPATLDRRPRPLPSLDQQLHATRTQPTATQSTAVGDQLAHTLGQLIDAGYAIGPTYGPATPAWTG